MSEVIMRAQAFLFFLKAETSLDVNYITKDTYDNIEVWTSKPSYDKTYGVWSSDGDKLKRIPEYFNVEFENDNPCDCMVTIANGIG